MDIAISRNEALEKLARARARFADIRKEAQAKVEEFISGAEVVGGAFATSYAVMRFSKDGTPAQIMGLDADLVLGGALFLGGLFELAGDQSGHLASLGAGALSSWASREGANMGDEARLKHLASAPPQQIQQGAHVGGNGFVPAHVRAAA